MPGGRPCQHEPTHPPKLTKRILRDDNALSDAITQAVAAHPHIRELSRQIRHIQDELRDSSDRRAWRIYLAAEALQIQRLDEETLLVARWAYRQGRRTGRRRARRKGRR